MVKLYDEERKLQQRSVKYLVARQWLRPYYGGKVTLKDKKKWYDCSVHNLQEVGVKVDYRSPLNKEQVMVIKQILHDHWDKKGVRAMLARSYNVTKGCITRIAKGHRKRNPPKNQTEVAVGSAYNESLQSWWVHPRKPCLPLLLHEIR
jgi:hypothetical protein